MNAITKKKPAKMARRVERRKVRVGAGRDRQTYKIKEWLDRQGLYGRDLAKQLGIADALVSQTIHGIRNHRPTLSLLRDLGCPEDYLSLPNDMRENAA